MRSLPTSLGLTALSVLLLACSETEPLGELPDGQWLDGADPDRVLNSELCLVPAPGSTPLRRLTNAEYENTLVDVGMDGDRVRDAVAALPSEPTSLGFRNGAEALNVNSLMAQKYKDIAQELAGELTAKCPAGEAEEDCAQDFVESMGLLLHRRPLSHVETTAYLKLYDTSRSGGDSFARGLAWVVEAMLQSPHFLYRVEIPDEHEPVRVTGYEMASRLSYTFWQAPPDQELLDAAEQGELSTDAQVLDQVRRLLSHERALRVYEFFEQWLDLDELEELERDETLYPDLDSNLALLLKAESRAFIQSLLRSGDASLHDLYAAHYTYANAALADHYGLEAVEGDAFVRVEAPGRSGILTQGMLAAQDGATRTSIVRRGLKVRTDLLCQIVPAPPDDVDLTLDGIDVDLTQAERLALHSESPQCKGCHQLMDPIGMVFEGFDAVGRQRSHDEYGSPVSVAGEITHTMDLDGPITGVHELADQLVGSREAEQCYLIQNFRFFFGREATRADLCSQAQLTRHFRESDHSLSELFVGLATTDTFLYKAARNAGSAGAGSAGADSTSANGEGDER